MITTLIELTGRICALSATRQAMKTLWCRDLLLNVESGSQPGEGRVKIQFSGERLSLLDAVQVGEWVTVAFSIRGVEYEREGTTKHLIILIGQHLWIHPAAPRKLTQTNILPIEVAEYDVADLDNVTDNSGFQPQLLRLGSRMTEPSGEPTASLTSNRVGRVPKGSRQQKDRPSGAGGAPSANLPKASFSEEPPF